MDAKVRAMEPNTSTDPVVIHAGPLEAIVRSIFRAAGSGERESQLITDQLVGAKEAEEYVRWVRASPPMDGVDHVRMPGEPEEEYRAARGANGIPIDPTTWAEIAAAAASVGTRVVLPR